MITEHDLNEAIAECQGIRNPDAKTCMMLASYFTIKNEMFPNDIVPINGQYSYDASPTQIEETIDYESDTDFGVAIYGRSTNEILAIIDEAMDAVQVLNPQLYKSIMRKIES